MVGLETRSESAPHSPMPPEHPREPSPPPEPSAPVVPVNAPPVAAPMHPANQLTPEEQMALFEKELKENDWGHQPC